jgi:hypothetical protein
VKNSLTSLPHLELLPLGDLLEHERHDDQRAAPLINRIQESGVLRNPPIVTQVQDGSSRHMILDGANRVTALQKLGFEHVVVQIVEPDDPGLKLYNWNHVVWDFEASELLAGIDQLPDLFVVRGDHVSSISPNEQDLARFESVSGDLHTICSSAQDLVSRVSQLNSLVDIYQPHASLDRTSEWSMVRLKSTYENLCGLVIFPRFEIRQVLFLAGRGCLLPTGITRFTVSPRVLHLNYPLEAMAREEPIDAKNLELQNFLQQRVASKGVRYYAEATYLFDE